MVIYIYITSTIMAIAMKGLKLKPKNEGLINVAVSDGLEHIKLPNRTAHFFTKWFCFKSIRWRRSKNHGNTTRNCI